MIELTERIPEPKLSLLSRMYLDIADSSPKEPNEPGIPRLLLRAATMTGGEILDVACGSGKLAYEMAQCTTQNVIGLDNDPEAIATARKYFGSRRPNLGYVLKDAYHLDESYRNADAVISKTALHHFDELELALDQMLRAANDTGLILIMDFDRARFSSILQHTTLRKDVFEQVYSIVKEGKHIEEKLRHAGLHRSLTLPTYISVMAAYTSNEIADAFRTLGYKASVIPSSKDNGITTVALKKNESKIRSWFSFKK